MLITFRSKAAGNITMFGNVAMTLLKMTGHSGTVPGAFSESDIPHALASLRTILDTAACDAEADVATDDSSTKRVSLKQRAYPLIQMLVAASAHGGSVTWDRESPAG
jgi:hypothetical protein